MTATAIIIGAGFDRLRGMHIERRENMTTPFGEPSGPLVFARMRGDKSSGGAEPTQPWVFLPRHGIGHAIPPHRVNYRANIWALKSIGIERIIAFSAVGGILATHAPGDVVIPEQIIDYTWGRRHTFFDGVAAAAMRGDAMPKQNLPTGVRHIEFSQPYCEATRQQLIAAAKASGVDVTAGAVYAATQGPRLETAAEIDRLERDGASIVGMTGMPEAALARELEIHYAAIAMVVNPAAGRGAERISMPEIEKHMTRGMKKAMEIIRRL